MISRLILLAGCFGLAHAAGLLPVGEMPNQDRGCRFHVTADVLNVRSAPNLGASAVDQLRRGMEITAQPVLNSGFRQLGPGEWAAREYLAPVSGSDCGGPSGTRGQASSR